MNTANLNTDCKTCRTHLADLLLDDSFAVQHADVAAHLAACSACSTELAELKATFALLDNWTAPEPSPYFDTKLHARLREAQAAAPESLWERLQSFLTFSTGRHLRPAMTGALAFVLLVSGGGTLMEHYQGHSANNQASATVNDLKILDNNAQALQQMDQLLDEQASDIDESAPPTT